MHFPKKLISVGLILVLLVGLIFHGYFYERRETEKKESGYDSTETVRLWYSDENLTDYFTNAAVSFHEQNPDIRVIPTLVSSSEYLDKIYEASIEGDDFPDIYLISNDSLEKAYLSGLASQVQEEKTVTHEHYSQAAIDAVTYASQVIGYPLFFETSVLAYNRTYLENWAEAVNSGEAEDGNDGKLSEEDLKETVSSIEDSAAEEAVEEAEENKEPVTYEDYVPHNIDELLSFADAYNAPDGVLGVFKWDVTDVFYNYFFVGNYLNVGGPAGDDAQNVDIYNANAISCLEVYQNLNQFFSIDAETSNYQSVLQDFIDGKSVFTVVTSDAIAKIRDAQKEALDKYKEADALARNEAEHMSQIENAEAIAGVNKDSEKKDGSSDSSASASDSSSEKSEEVKEPTELQKAADELKAKLFDIEFARIPMVSEKLDAKSLSVTDALVVNGFSKHMSAANKFAAFAATTYCGSIYNKSGKVAASTDAQYEDEDLKVFQSEYANSVPLPKMMEASNLWVQVEVIFTNVWEGADIQPLLKNLSEQIANQTIDEDDTEDAQ